MKTLKPFFSIVIPTLNEEKYLPRLLEDLSTQTFTDFEVIHVDGSSEDKTVQKSSSFLKKFQLVIKVIPRKNVATQRNYGAKYAKADWVIFMDADNQLPNSFLEKLHHTLENANETDFFTCWMKAEHTTSRDERIIAAAYNIGLYIAKAINKPTAAGALIGIKRELILKYPFNDKSDVFDDALLIETLSKKGFAFSIFKEPQYSYCFRRFKKSGVLKLIRFYAECNLYTLLGKDVSDLQKDYPMNGGTEYQDFLENHFSIFYKFEDKINQISKKQLQIVKDIVNSARSFNKFR